MTMKLRNRLIALVCLLLFLGFGAALFLSTSVKKPFAIILFVSDNITPSSLTATRLFSGGGDARLQLEDLPSMALCRNAANDFSVPDMASAATMLAAGKRVDRGALCIEASGAKFPSLLEMAASKGRATGLITTGSLVGATTAAYYAKSINVGDQLDLATQFTSHAPFDLVIGGDMSPTNGTNAKSPLEPSSGKNIDLIRSISDLENQPFGKNTPILALFSQQQFSISPAEEGNSNAPTLSDLVRVAILHLQGNRNGYLLVVDDPAVGKAAASNDAETMFKSILVLDQAMATARRYAGEKALIIVAGKENIGGLQLNGYPFLGDKGVAILSMNGQGNPSLCWASGPGFSMEKPLVTDQGKKTNPAAPGILSQPSACTMPQAIGIASDVMVLGVGQGAEKIKGFMDLTDIHHLIHEEL